jgi:hypothetical protein
MFPTKAVEKKIKTYFVFNNFFSENCVFCDIMWEKINKTRQATDDNTLRRMRFACWITKATDTYLECVIIIAFPRQ